MQCSTRQWAVILTGMVCLPFQPFAGPMIDIDTTEFNLGIIREGEKSIIKKVFSFKNAGDSDLVLRNVRPSCGCTTVEVDTTIPPGKEGAITSELNMSTLNEGDFVKTITVISNARNTPSLKLSMRGTYITLIEPVQSAALNLSGIKGSDTGAVITIKSSRRFAVEKAEFKFDESAGGVSWETVIPLDYTQTLVDSAARETSTRATIASLKKKPFVYRVRVHFKPALKEDTWGDFCLTTNIGTRKEIRFPGTLGGKGK
ncbi:MAG: DUF1573 domain-containing protein [Chitinispirillaceae bacterium]|nr:DUF1573 domain-containing protein [Chitinispirillaceae bacterium]